MPAFIAPALAHVSEYAARGRTPPINTVSSLTSAALGKLAIWKSIVHLFISAELQKSATVYRPDGDSSCDVLQG